MQRSQYLVSELIPVPAPQLVLIASPLLLMALYGLVRGRALALALALAIASNLSFIYATFVLVSWTPIEDAYLRMASVSAISLPSGANLYMLTVLLGTSLLSLVVSHVLYIFSLRSKA
jgi:hypothetical protein